VVIVALEEGPRELSNMLDCSREELRVGLPVEVTFEDASAEVTQPKFRLRRRSTKRLLVTNRRRSRRKTLKHRGFPR